jgi:histidine triad (HIT) family protein
MLAFLGGVALGGYLFVDSRPRSFLALARCDPCFRPSELVGLLASAGIRRVPDALPLVVGETERCLAIEHPFRKARLHLVVLPKKDVRDIADISIDDHPHVLDCLALIRRLVVEHGLRDYRVETNGAGLQHVGYLHFHLVSTEPG